MAYPNLYGVTYSYTGFQQAQGDNSFPGTQLDADLAGLQSSISGLAAFVEQGFRSDGALANGSVGYDQLSPSLQLAGISAASAWLTGTAYVVGAGVVQSQKLYRGLIAHTSGVFATDLAAGKWIFVANIGDLSTTGVSVAGHLPVFSDTTAKLIADSGVALSSLAPLVSPAFTTPNIGAATGTSLALSGSLTAASLAFNALTVTGLVTITPTANTITQGLSVAQTLPAGSAGINNAYSANLISIINGGYQTPAGGAADSFGLFPVVSGLRVNYTAAGSGLGNYPIHIGGLFATKATSVGQQLVGLNGTTYTDINSSGNDSFWSVIGYANIGPNANIGGIYGLEAEVATSAGATILYRVGVSAVSMGPTTGSTIDAAFAVTAQADKYGAPAPWNNALVLWKSDGATNPVASNVIVTNATFTMSNCINLSTVTFLSKIFDFGASVFQMNGSGHMTIGGAALGTNTLAVGGTQTIQTTSGGALTVGPNGGTNPVLNVDASTASQVAGLNVLGAVTGGTVAIAAIDSGANASLSISPKGTGTVTISALRSTNAVLTTPNLGTPSAVTLTNGAGLPTTGLTGTLQAAQEPAHTGDMTNTAGSLATLVTKTNGVAFTAYATAAIGQLPGTTTNDSASAGNIGEIITSTITRASATAITTATPKTVTSISLTAGDWEVDVVGGFVPANTTSVTQLVVSMSTTTNTLDTTEGKLGVLTVPGTTFDGATQAQVSLPPFRFSLSATTTVYMVAQSTFTVSTNAAFGVIKARRVR